MVWLTWSRLLYQAAKQARELGQTVASKQLKPKSSWVRKKSFFDSLRIYVRSGGGGQGFQKYGGLGGKGGDIIIQAKKGHTLKSLLGGNPGKRFIAGTGDNSQKRKLVGEPGRDCVIEVPVGICVRNSVGRVIGDLNEPRQTIRVARGGAGGSPVNHFLGQKGQVEMIQMDLKLLADVGLVGFPNAGKSTFLSAISRATPKIANYPFTTIQPQIGVMEFSDHRQITVADLPGLIEGAHVNVGMGHRFLKHVERTKLLLFIVDVNGFQLPRREHFRSAFETVMLLNKELELYKADLVEKPAVLAINKVDTLKDNTLIEEIKRQLSQLPDLIDGIDETLMPSQFVHFDEIIPISAKDGNSVEELKLKLRELLDFYADKDFSKTPLGFDLIPTGDNYVSNLEHLERSKVRPV